MVHAALDPGLRRGDGTGGQATYIPPVMPAPSGIQRRERNRAWHWTPAFAAVTMAGAGA